MVKITYLIKKLKEYKEIDFEISQTEQGRLIKIINESDAIKDFINSFGSYKSKLKKEIKGSQKKITFFTNKAFPIYFDLKTNFKSHYDKKSGANRYYCLKKIHDYFLNKYT